MITTIYKCDRCGKEQTDEKQMWGIGVYVTHLPSKPIYKQWEHLKHPIWCRACVDALQLLGFPKPVDPAQTAVKEITLEEKLREIIAEIATEEVQSAIDNR